MATKIQSIAAAVKELRACKGRATVSREQLSKISALMQETMGPVLMDLDRMFNRKKGSRILDCHSITIFESLGGHIHIARLLCELKENGCAEIHVRDVGMELMKECLNILTELAIVRSSFGVDLANNIQVFRHIVSFISWDNTFESALPLVQTLLQEVEGVYPLERMCFDSNLDHLHSMVSSLSPRRLALFCRVVSTIICKSARDAKEGLPPPECTPPDLCTVCLNAAAIVKMPQFISKLVRLIRLPKAPWGSDPNTPFVWLPRLSETIVEDDWSLVSRRLRQQDINGSTSLPTDRDRGQVQLLVPEGQLPPTPQFANTVTVQVHGAPTHIISLVRFEDTMWSSLRSDIIQVLWSLLGGKTRKLMLDILSKENFVNTLKTVFFRLDWTIKPIFDDGDDPNSCDQAVVLHVQLLRILQSFCERTDSQSQWHRLLLSEREREEVYGDDDKEERLAASSSSPSSPGLIVCVARTLMSQSGYSELYFWLACCLQKWVQGATSREQDFIISRAPGLIRFVVDQIMSLESICRKSSHSASIAQVNFDLLGHLTKGNKRLFCILERTLLHYDLPLTHPSGDALDRLTRIAMGKVMDAAIFLQSIVLRRLQSPSPSLPSPSPSSSPSLPSPSSSPSPSPSSPSSAEDKSRVLPFTFRNLRVREIRDQLRCLKIDFENVIQKTYLISMLMKSTHIGDVKTENTGERLFASFYSRRIELAVKLLLELSAKQLSSETMCVMNAFLGFFFLAHRENQFKQFFRSFLDRLCRCNHDKTLSISPPSDSDNTHSPLPPSPSPPPPAPPSLSNDVLSDPSSPSRRIISDLMVFLESWRVLYKHHQRERVCLELSWGVAFDEWKTIADRLEKELVTSIQNLNQNENQDRDEILEDEILASS